MAEEIKDRLKALRCKLNIKQREVAERLGVRVGLVGNWESGVAAIPSTRIYQLCHEYNVRREWLETGVGEMFEKKEPPKLDDFDDETIFLESMRRKFKGLPDEKKRAFINFCRDLLDKQRREEKAPAPRPSKDFEPPADFYRTVADNRQDGDPTA